MPELQFMHKSNAFLYDIHLSFLLFNIGGMCVYMGVCAHALVHTCILCTARMWRSEVSLGELAISYLVEAMISLGSSSSCTSLQRTLLSLPPILP